MAHWPTLNFILVQAESRGLSTGIKIPAGKGKRLIIVGMGSSEGWLDGSVECWKRSAKKGPLPADYHNDFDAAGFEKWLKAVLKLLPDNAVLVMDNASYHSKKVRYMFVSYIFGMV